LGTVQGVNEFRPGLEGVIAFETEIAEPDREGSALRYRGIDIEELVGHYTFEQVWGLLVDSNFEPGMPHAERIELQDPSGSVMADLQAGLATLGPKWKLEKLVDIESEQARDDLGRLSAAALSIVAQAARGADKPPVPEIAVNQGENAAAQFLIRWRGEADPRHVRAIDTYWVIAAEHGLNASTFTARIAASTGADCAAALSSAVGTLSGPLHGGAPARVLPMLDAVEADGDAKAYVLAILDRGERIMGFGHRIYRSEDPRARVLRRTAEQLGSPRFEVADAFEAAALEALRERHPERPLPTNVDFWAAVVLDLAHIPYEMYPAMFGCARVAGWSAHILEERRTGRLIRPSARYVGPAAHSLAAE
jgi:citrate synthase